MSATLTDLCTAIVDCEHKTAPRGDGFALSVGTKAMKDGRLVLFACKPVSVATYDLWTRRLVPEQGDLILAREAPVGDVIRVPNDIRICLGQRTVLIRPDAERVDPRFLHYWLLGPTAQADMHSRAAGATVSHLNVEDIRALDISALPRDRDWQRNAGATLGAIDDLIENNRRRIALLERMAQAIYREWFVHFRYPGHEDDELVDSPLGAIPEGWVAARTSELIEDRWLEIGDGYRAKNSEFSADGVPFVRVGNMQDGSLQLQGSDLLPPEYVLRVGGKASQPGDCLISMKGTVGRVAFIGGATPTVIYSPQVSYWRSLDEGAVSPIYLRRWIQSEHFRLQCAEVKGATDMADYVNLKDQRRMEILLPHEGVQRNFAKVVGPVHDLADSLSLQASALSDLRGRLLPKLVTGAIDVSQLDLDALLEEPAA